ncbi:hypothetical protein [Rhodococcus qingshengii]|uniref:hypothetical protein n=1 Tax=Rhodococcus qingshengii TaxID=334542 RepID=UPI0030CA6018
MSFERSEQGHCLGVEFCEQFLGDAVPVDSFLEDEVAAILAVGDEGVDPGQCLRRGFRFRCAGA